MPSDDDHRPNQHPSDGKQACSAPRVHAVGQLWPNEVQKQALGKGAAEAVLRGSLPCLGSWHACCLD